jgi:ribosome biogenesis GTPase A
VERARPADRDTGHLDPTWSVNQWDKHFGKIQAVLSDQKETSFKRDVLQAVQKAKSERSCKFWKEILLTTPKSLNYTRSLYVDYDPIYVKIMQ